jgi:hypothetical protein
MTGDRNYPLLNASKAEWPGIKVLTCWPHIAWKGSHENMRILVNKDQMPRCVADLRRLADCRSQAMFDAVGKFILRLLTVLPEVAYATWLNNQYLTPPWNVWFRTVSGIPGVQPSSQPQESYHKSIKKHSGIRLRAATERRVGDHPPSDPRCRLEGKVWRHLVECTTHQQCKRCEGKYLIRGE